jgi:hypothetical protein
MEQVCQPDSRVEHETYGGRQDVPALAGNRLEEPQDAADVVGRRRPDMKRRG